MNRAEDITFVLGADTKRFRQGMGVAQTAIKGFFKGAAVAGVGLAAALAKAKAAVSELDKIGKDARSGGLDPETYQEYAFAADLAGLSVSELNKGLRTFAKNSNDAVLGSGLMKTSLERLNPALLENIKNAKSQEERLRLVANAVKNATSEIGKQAIAQAAFGGKGTTFINFLEQGASGFDRLSEKAREMGIVIDNDVVKNAEEMNDKLSTASRIIDANLNKAFVELAPVMVEISVLLADLLVNLKPFTEEAIRLFRVVSGDTSIQGLEAKLESLKKSLEFEKSNLGSATGFVLGIDQEDIDETEVKIATLESQISEIERIKKRSEQFNKKNTVPKIVDGTITSIEKPKKSSRSSSISEAEKQAKAIAGVVEALTFELEQLGRTEEGQRLYNELKRAGVDVNSLAGQEISKLVSALDDENSRLERNEKIMTRMVERQEAIKQGNEFLITSAADVGAAFTSSSEEGVNALKALIVQLVAAYAQAKLLGSGPLAGILGGGSGGGFSISPSAAQAFAAGTGGLFAKGGISNVPAIFGEGSMAEAAVPLPDGRSIPVSFKDADFSKGGESMVFSPTYMIDAKDANQESLGRIERALQERDRDFHKNVISVIKNGRSRGQLKSL